MALNGYEGATYDANIDGSPETSTGALPYRLDDQVGTTYRGKPVLDKAGIIQHIDSGARLDTSDNVVTYAFADFQHALGLNNNPSFGEGKGYSPMSEAERAVARQGLQLWDDLIPLNFVEVKPGSGASSWGKNTVDIWLQNTTSGPAQAWAYYPGYDHQYTRVASDVWSADPSVNWTNQWLNYSGYGWTTLVHEEGHALGLSHPGAYNFGPGFTVNYANGAEYAQDSRQYSIMSYWSGTETGARTLDVAVGLANYPQTPMIHDILTIQSMYGADPTTRAGDTVYGFNSNAGRDIYDFTKNLAPNLAIYDAGGNDTLDLSGAKSGVFLDLRPGSFSSAAVRPTLEQANAATAQFNAATDEAQGDFGMWTESSLNSYLSAVGANRAAQIASVTGVSGVQALSHYNISIAYNTIIENAIGGDMRDYLVGNQVSNKLIGNGGNDVLNGLGGDDFLTGGTGSDEFRFTETGGRDTITDFTSGSDKINLSEIDANSGVAGDQAFAYVGSSAFSAAGQLRDYVSSGHHYLAGDVNGDGVADFTIDLGSATAVVGDFIL